MRLINLQTFVLEEFDADDEIPDFAILSHTWEKEEVTFRDFQSPTRTKLKGWQKIQRFCNLAASKYGAKYAWADTCCIDKSSSAELSEAINSMYRWYRISSACLVYLSDVSNSTILAQEEKSEFVSSRWFKRGWTLQELLAPTRVIFYNASWAELGSKGKLENLIVQATKIPREFLYRGSAQRASIAQRMSWAAKRATTRSEDLAYCLIGLFQVNMPLLYGEGGREAFFRLQSELLRNSGDESIFAWARWGEKTGMLANSPADFEGSYDIYTTVIPDKDRGLDESYHLTNRGLKISMSMYQHSWSDHSYRNHTDRKIPELYALPLNCFSRRLPGECRQIIVFLTRCFGGDGIHFRRIGPMTAWPTWHKNNKISILQAKDGKEQQYTRSLKTILVKQFDPEDYLEFHKGSISVYEPPGFQKEAIGPTRFRQLWWELLDDHDRNVLDHSIGILYKLLSQPKLAIEASACLA